MSADASGQKLRITVLISGTGSNLQALIDSCNTAALPNAKIVRVVSDRKDAYGLKRAEQVGIATTYHGIIPYKNKYPDLSEHPKFEEARKAYDIDLSSIVLGDRPDIVVCAGFMRILLPAFLEPLKEAHTPSSICTHLYTETLSGLEPLRRAWEEFTAGNRTKTGVMVHYVIAEVDMGTMIVQQEVEIEGCKTLEELEGRMHGTEHGLIVEGTRRVLEKQSSPKG